MRIISIFLILLLNLPGTILGADPKVELYVDQLIAKVSNMLSDSNLSEDQKINKSRQLIGENLDLKWMAGYSLGKHRRGMNSAKLNEFTNIYSTYMIKSYSQLVKEYKGEKAKIIKVGELNDHEYVVKSEIIRPNQPSTKVDYLVRDLSKGKNTNLKMFDIITEGVSLLNSQKSEFDSLLNQNGITGLIDELKKKL